MDTLWVSGGGDEKDTPLLTIEFSPNFVLGGTMRWAEHSTSPEANTGRAGAGSLFFRGRLHLIGGVTSRGAQLTLPGSWTAPAKLTSPGSADLPARKRACPHAEASGRKQRRKRASNGSRDKERPSSCDDLQLDMRVPAKAFRLGMGVGLTAGVGLMAVAKLQGHREAGRRLRLQEEQHMSEILRAQAAAETPSAAAAADNGGPANVQNQMEEAQEVVRGLTSDLQRSRQSTWASLGLVAALALQLRGSTESAKGAERQAAAKRLQLSEMEVQVREMEAEIANLKKGNVKGKARSDELSKLLERAQRSEREQVQTAVAQRAAAVEEAQRLRETMAATEARLKLEAEKEVKTVKGRMATMATEVQSYKQWAEALQADLHVYKAHCSQMSYFQHEFQAGREQVEASRRAAAEQECKLARKPY